MKAGGEFYVAIGKMKFIGVRSIINIDGKDILQINPPEETNGVPRISAMLFDRDGNEVAQILDNEWTGSPDTFDIQTSGGRFKLRSQKGHIDLVLRVEPPNGIVVEQIDLAHNGKRVFGSEKGQFSFVAQMGEIHLPSEEKLIRDAHYGFCLDDAGVSMGADDTITYDDVTGRAIHTPTELKAVGTKIEVMDLSEPGKLVLPTGVPLVRVTSTDSAGPHRAEMIFQIPWKTNAAKSATTKYVDPFTKNGQNEPCPCRSGKMFKHCHGQSH